MLPREFTDRAPARGWRVNAETGAVSGEQDGAAFRITQEGDALSLELSVNIPDKHLPRLQEKLSAAYPGLTAQRHNYGLLFTASAPSWTADGVAAFLEKAAGESVRRVGAVHENTYERYGEAFYVYLRGAAGALAGAVVGAIPWMVLGGFGWISMWLGAAISIGSFFGYRLCKGAHSTRFATFVILFFSILAMLGASFSETVSAVITAAGELGWTETLSQVFTGDYLLSLLRSAGIGLLFGLAGLFAIRKRISEYTHEPRFLRRDKRPKDR